jgi:hypothetical protein
MTKMMNKHYGPEFNIQQYLDDTNLERIKIDEENDEENEDDKFDDNLDVDDEGIRYYDQIDDEPRQTITLADNLTRTIVKNR